MFLSEPPPEFLVWGWVAFSESVLSRTMCLPLGCFVLQDILSHTEVELLEGEFGISALESRHCDSKRAMAALCQRSKLGGSRS